MIWFFGVLHFGVALQVESPGVNPGGLLKYDLGRDVLLKLEKLIHFYTKFCQNMRPIFIAVPQILSEIY